MDPAHFTFRPRSEVETDPSFKQLIPYVVLRDGECLFHYRRGAAGSESRLAALRSIGIGGHINTGDAMGSDPYRSGMLRELAEELDIQCDVRESFLGFINDDRTPVGQVHLGVVHLLDLDAQHVRVRDAAVSEPGFAPLHQLVASSEQFETWSQFVLAELACISR